MKCDDRVKQLIDNWNTDHIDNLSELFNDFIMVVLRSVRGDQLLNTNVIIKAIKSLRVAINPSRDKDILYFSDLICDKILVMFEGIGEKQLPELFTFIHHCEEYAFSK